jgi:hypothetical protein
MGNLEQSVERFLRTGEGSFEDIALNLFRYQFDKNIPYQSFCVRQGIRMSDVTNWEKIPAVPVQAFKSAELATFPIGRAAAVFESSGTTVTTPSRHYLKTLSYYEASIKSTFGRAVIPAKADDKWPFLILTPPPNEAPRSSLTWMMDVLKRQWGAPESQYFVRNGRLDELWLATMIAKVQNSTEPALLLGTTIAFLAFFDYCRKAGRRFVLPKGSRVMDTGGMKTQKREITRVDFVRQVTELLGIPEVDCINEYGMCEMSSQFYGVGASTRLEGPSWVRTMVIDSSNGQEAAEGQTGLLRHFDLANVDSVIAIQTEDLGRKDGSGFVLLGRASQAELKGCSVSAEAFIQ